VRATTLEDLRTHLQRSGARIICGGTDLLVKMRHGMAAPDVLIDIGELEELAKVQVIDDEVHIGAATRESILLRTPQVGDHLPLLCQVLQSLGAEQIRNRGSLGGNLANASPAADSAIPLLLYDARLRLVDATQDRWVSIDEFLLGPGKTVLSSGEFIHTVAIPFQPPEWRAFYHKVGRRRALIISIASLGVLIDYQDGVVHEIRVAAGSVAPTAIRLRAVEELLAGRALSKGLIEEARLLASASVCPINDIRATETYRRTVVGNLLERFLMSLLDPMA